MKKILFNFGPLKIGGGQNVALNFLETLSEYKTNDLEIIPSFVVAKDSNIHKKVKRYFPNNSIYIVSENPVLRVLQELFILSFKISKKNTDVIYSYFGYALILGNSKQVSGSADSNLYFPEIDFWNQESFFMRIKRYLVDRYRIFGLKNCDGIIYENAEMYKRARKMFPSKHLILIMPSFYKALESKETTLDFNKFKFRILCVSGWQKNKNITMLPEIAGLIAEYNSNVEFVITAAPDKSECYKEFSHNLVKFDVYDYFKLIGNRPKNELEDLYTKNDCVILLSLLESFSNNIIEAWHFKKPLIVSDESWSRSICMDAAIYVDRNNAKQIAESILDLSANPKDYEEIVKKGVIAFSKHPTIRSRFEQEIKFLKSI